MADKFLLVGEKANLPAVRDANKLYWVSDTRELYKGNDLYTEAVRVVATLPTTPAQGVLYILPTGEVQSYNGTAWTVVAHPYVADGTLSATNTNAEVPTAKVVYDSIVEAINEATGGGDVVNDITSTKAGLITVTKGDTDADVAIKGVIVNPTYDATTRKITLPYADGTEALEITLGKDIFIDPTADNKYNPDTKCIEIYLNDGEGGDPTKISIPAESLIDVYTGAETTTATVSVSDTNVITADVKISTSTINRLKTDATGLLVDVEDLATKAELKDATDAATDLEKRVKANEDAINVINGDAATDGSIAKAVADAKTEIKTTTDGLQDQIDAINHVDTGILKQAQTYTDESLAWGTF